MRKRTVCTNETRYHRDGKRSATCTADRTTNTEIALLRMPAAASLLGVLLRQSIAPVEIVEPMQLLER